MSHGQRLKKPPIEEALWWCQLGSDKGGFKTGFGTVVTQDHPEAGKLLGKQKALAAQRKYKGGYNMYHFVAQEKEFWKYRDRSIKQIIKRYDTIGPP